MATTTNRLNAENVLTSKAKAKTKRRPSRSKKKGNQSVPIAVGVACMTVLLSAWFNIEAFNAGGFNIKGTVVGLYLPIIILALTYVGHATKDSLWIMGGSYGLAIFALIVSMPHLAHGYEAMGLRPHEAWAMAVVTDLTQVVMKAHIIHRIK